MPINSEWVEPEVFMTHNGVTVFHMYRHGDISQGMQDYWFSLDILCGEGECNCSGWTCRNVFDVRALSTYTKRTPIKKAIEDAIDKGELVRKNG